MTFRSATFVATTALLIAIGCKGIKEDWNEQVHGPDTEQLADDVTNGDDPDLRREAIHKLSRSSAGDDPVTLNLFAEVLKTDPSALVRSAAATALGSGGDPAYLEALASGLKDKVVLVRWDTARALDELTGPAAVFPLIDASKDPAVEVRIATCKALRHYRQQEVARALIARLDDPDVAVRHEAHESLTVIFEEDRGPRSTDWAGADEGHIPPPDTRNWWERMEDRMTW